MRAQSDYGSDARGGQASGSPSEWMTVAEMQEYMHAGRTKAYELVRMGEVRLYRLGRRILVSRPSFAGTSKRMEPPGDQTGC